MLPSINKYKDRYSIPIESTITVGTVDWHVGACDFMKCNQLLKVVNFVDAKLKLLRTSTVRS